MSLGADLRALFALADDRPDEDVLTAVTDARAALETAQREIARLTAAAPADLDALRAQAADGRQYRDDLTAAALVEAVRALGAEAEERYRPVLAPLSLDQIRQMTADWKAQADVRLPGGRVTVDTTPKPEPARRGQVPIAAKRA